MSKITHYRCNLCGTTGDFENWRTMVGVHHADTTDGGRTRPTVEWKHPAHAENHLCRSCVVAIQSAPTPEEWA